MRPRGQISLRLLGYFAPAVTGGWLFQMDQSRGHKDPRAPRLLSKTSFQAPLRYAKSRPVTPFIRRVGVTLMHHVIANCGCLAHQNAQHAETIAGLGQLPRVFRSVPQGSRKDPETPTRAPILVPRGSGDVPKRLLAPLHDQWNAMPPFIDAALVSSKTARCLVPGILFNGKTHTAVVARKYDQRVLQYS